MTVVPRGMRNAFRNATRAIAIVLILGLAIGLAFVMLVAHRSVSDKVATTLSSVGNTVNIGPPGYAAGGRLGSPHDRRNGPDRAPAGGHGLKSLTSSRRP